MFLGRMYNRRWFCWWHSCREISCFRMSFGKRYLHRIWIYWNRSDYKLYGLFWWCLYEGILNRTRHKNGSTIYNLQIWKIVVFVYRNFVSYKIHFSCFDCLLLNNLFFEFVFNQTILSLSGHILLFEKRWHLFKTVSGNMKFNMKLIMTDVIWHLQTNLLKLPKNRIYRHVFAFSIFLVDLKINFGWWIANIFDLIFKLTNFNWF